MAHRHALRKLASIHFVRRINARQENKRKEKLMKIWFGEEHLKYYDAGQTQLYMTLSKNNLKMHKPYSVPGKKSSF